MDLRDFLDGQERVLSLAGFSERWASEVLVPLKSEARR
jgi:hypothetical protein